MGKDSNIGWLHRHLPDGTSLKGMTFNPWWGCFKIAPECKHCYAADIAKHYGHNVWGPAVNTSRRFFGEKHWTEPLLWNRQAEKEGHRRSVFCASMADVYEEHPQLLPEREKLWQLIEATPWLNWLLLTKRPENILRLSPWGYKETWPDNVWVGTSVGTQKRADEDRVIDLLLEVPAVVRFLSVEPMLGAMDITPWLSCLQWVICGGESGAEARTFKSEWAASLRDQCVRFDVPFYFKQFGGRYHDSGGRLLDDRTWDGMPPEVPLYGRREVLV